MPQLPRYKKRLELYTFLYNSSLFLVAVVVLLGSLRSFCFTGFSFCFGFCAEGFEAALLSFADGADCFVVGLEPLGDDGGEQAAVLVFLFFGAFFGVVEVDGEEFLGAGEVYVVVEGDEGVGGVFSVVHVDDG